MKTLAKNLFYSMFRTLFKLHHWNHRRKIASYYGLRASQLSEFDPHRDPEYLARGALVLNDPGAVAPGMSTPSKYRLYLMIADDQRLGRLLGVKWLDNPVTHVQPNTKDRYLNYSGRWFLVTL